MTIETQHAEHKLAITQFDKFRRPWGRCGLATWGQVLGWATRHYERPLSERDGPGYVPGYLTDTEHRKDFWRPPGANAYRRKENVKAVCMLAIDQDDGTPLDKLRLMLIHHEWVAYTTHRHTREHPRFRILVPLKRPVFGKDWPDFWAGAINQFTRGEALERITADTQVKDAGRFYWWPVCEPGAERWVRHNRGLLLDPATVPTLPLKMLGYTTQGVLASGEHAWRNGQPIRSGTRDNTLRNVARYLRGLGWEEEAIYQEVVRINRAQCQPPYEGAEEMETCRRVARGAVNRFGPDEAVADQDNPLGLNLEEEVPEG